VLYLPGPYKKAYFHINYERVDASEHMCPFKYIYVVKYTHITPHNLIMHHVIIYGLCVA